jgi:cation transport ATPase
MPGETPLFRTRETLIAILATVGILAHLVLRYLFEAPAPASLVPLFLALALGGIPLVAALSRKLFSAQFGSDLLAGISIVVSALLGEWN